MAIGVTTRAGIVIAGIVLLTGCAMHNGGGALAMNDKTSAAQPAPQKIAFSITTPIDQIAADQRGKAVLERDVPGVMSNSHYELYSCMSLSQLASLSGGRLSQDKLSHVNQDLAELSPNDHVGQ